MGLRGPLTSGSLQPRLPPTATVSRSERKKYICWDEAQGKGPADYPPDFPAYKPARPYVPEGLAGPRTAKGSSPPSPAASRSS